MSTKELQDPKITQESLVHLRDEIYKENRHHEDFYVREILFKINSCLFREYPHNAKEG